MILSWLAKTAVTHAALEGGKHVVKEYGKAQAKSKVVNTEDKVLVKMGLKEESEIQPTKFEEAVEKVESAKAQFAEKANAVANTPTGKVAVTVAAEATDKVKKTAKVVSAFGRGIGKGMTK